jgi:hypothetical protein
MIRTKGGSHPAAPKEVPIETEKNEAVDITGLPVCQSGQLQSRDTRAAEKACKGSIIAQGITQVEVALPEQRPILVDSRLLVFNGGRKGGPTTLYIHAFFSAPVSGTIVTSVKIKRINKGRYRLLSVATIPKIAGGNGSVESFNLRITGNTPTAAGR